MPFKTVKIKDVKSEFGQLVKVLRKRHKLSQQELATQLALSRITIQNLERGKNFTADSLLKVFEYFDLLDGLHNEVQKFRIEQETVKSLY